MTNRESTTRARGEEGATRNGGDGFIRTVFVVVMVVMENTGGQVSGREYTGGVSLGVVVVEAEAAGGDAVGGLGGGCPVLRERGSTSDGGENTGGDGEVDNLHLGGVGVGAIWHGLYKGVLKVESGLRTKRETYFE